MLTREQQILNAIAASGKALTVREIAAMVGLKSPASVHTYLDRMEAQGLVRQERGYVLVRDDR